MSINRRGDKWRARYYGPDGRERNKTFDRKVDAQRWIADQRARMSRGEWIDPAALRTEFGAVAREWLKTTLHLKPKTRHGYERLLERRVLPRWDHVPMAKVAAALPDWIAELADSAVSASQVRQTVYVLSSVCQYAIRTGRLYANPVAGLKLPRVTSGERRFLTDAEVGKLVAEAGPYGLFVRTLAYTGMRWGEATALQVRDLDVRRRRIEVQRAFVDVNGTLVAGTPKSHQSRSVPMPRSIARDLESLVQGRELDSLIFIAPNGGPLRFGNFRHRVWYPAVHAAGLDGFTPHGLRHTAASLYISAGTPPKVVQRILGHASISITMDLYGHLYADEMDTWADRLDETLVDPMRPECGQASDDDLEDPDIEGDTSC